MAASFNGSKQGTTPNREDVGSSSQGLGDIFLSHSGRQKPFVERLYDALVRANHTVFLDKHSLPVASPFPENIKTALRHCELGVIVLSEDFLTHKWPMIELELLFKGGKRVLPLFYMLSTEDLKSPTNLSRWQEKWKEMVRSQEQENQWAAALQRLPIIDGIVFHRQQHNEAAYINKVVAKICSIHRPYALYDQSLIQGCEALAKEITGYFDKLVENVNHPEEACMVGLHGVGGLGKTTLCKSMVNFYNSKYFGRSYLIEFPTARDMEKVVQECQRAMKQLFNLRVEGPEAKDFDQVVAQMKKHVGAVDVFLAIDNIWDHSIDEAARLLGVGFTANSKVLLTSRSREILWRLLCHSNQKNKDYYHIDSLPAPDMEVAFQIFQQIVKQGDLTSSPFRDRIDFVLKRCSKKNHGRYHPLAVRALGAIAARLFGRGDSKRNADSWSRILLKLENAELKDVDAAIKLNYDTLNEDQRHIFLDIAILFLNPAFKPFLKCTYANVNRWLQFYYKKFDEMDIDALIDDLAAAGVILIEKAQNDENMIEVHDLYVELAQKEATKGPRFLTSIKEAVEGTEWENLKRVILAKREEKLQLHQLEKQLHKCEKLELLYVYGIELEHFPESIASLRVLILQWPRHFDSKRTLLNLDGFVNLEYLSLENLPSLVKLEAQNGFPNLRMFFLRDCAHVEDLDVLRCSTQLEALVIDGHFHSEWLEEESQRLALKRLPDLSPALKLLNVIGCTALKRLPDLGGLTALETLWLHNNRSLVEMGAFSPALKTVIITDCQAVRLPDFGSVTGLEVLILQNTGLSEVGCLSSALKFLTIDGCCMLKKMPALGGMMGLETLRLMNNASLEEVGSLSLALKKVKVKMCGALKRMPELGGVTGLESLTLEDNSSLQEVGSLGSALKHMHLKRCAALKRTPDLGGVTGLESLTLEDNASLEEVGCLSPALKELKVQDCAALKMMPELEGLTSLTSLTLIGLSSLKELGCLGPAVEDLHVEGCGALKRMPDLGGVIGLESLTLEGNASLEEVGRLSPALKELEVEDCGALKTIPELEGLERLTLISVSSLKEVGSLRPALKHMHLERCGALKRMPNLGGVTGLESLTLEDNASLEEVGCLSPALKELFVRNCGALKMMPELEGLTGLKRLTVISVSSLKELGCLGPALTELHVEGCGALKRTVDLVGVTGLQSLTLKDNSSLEEVGRLSPALKNLFVKNCAALKTMSELEGLTGLERLTLEDNASLEEVGRLSPALKQLFVKNCAALKTIPELEGLTGLERLTLEDNATLEEVGRLSPVLEELEVVGCHALKRMPDLVGLTGLKRLHLWDNAALEEVGRLSPALAIQEEQALKRMADIENIELNKNRTKVSPLYLS